MADLAVIVPSRGRPEAAVALARVFADTCIAHTRLVFAVDDDDPTRDQYLGALDAFKTTSIAFAPSPSNMVTTLNWAAGSILSGESSILAEAPPFAVGFMGDDHCPRTYGWDQAYLDALRDLGTGIVYGNDLLQGHRLPTQCAMTADIVRALGYMSPPSLKHLAVDNWWLELGKGANCLRYLPDVIVEHRHPFAGKAQMDEGYQRVNSQAMYDHDLTEFERLRQVELPAAVAKIRALRGAA